MEQGQLTLFDFDGYDHRKLGMSFKDVIHCSTKICGHAFVLAIMLTYGSDFKIDDLPPVDQTIRTIRALPQKSDYSVTFGANGISAPKINLTDWMDVQRG